MLSMFKSPLNEQDLGLMKTTVGLLQSHVVSCSWIDRDISLVHVTTAILYRHEKVRLRKLWISQASLDQEIGLG